MRKIVLLPLIILLFACNQSEKKTETTSENNKETTENNNETTDTPETTKFKLLDNSSYDLSKLNHEGEIVNQRVWQDSNGENIALFTLKEEELFLYHYAINSDSLNLLRRVYDFEKDCDYDLTLEFIENATSVTDLDNNNIGEITFAYKKACISDVSPKELKLLILENGNKFIIRGLTIINMGEQKFGGEKNIDPSFDNAPEGFLSHANKVWDSINK